ncbi:MAG: extracellular solute-binding protein [Alphaproteobacteria bacterium]|nr:extracellular solute-binding protein [Alphaproteobacteria bacterium]
MAKSTKNSLDNILGEPKSRRKFISETAAVTGGIASILATGIPPAFAQERELKLLTWSHFVPKSDEELERQLKEFGKQAGIKVRVDRVAHLQLPAVLAGEVQGQKGHDLISLRNANSYLYSEHLETMDDLYEKIAKRGGGWTTDTVGKGQEGRQTALPWYFISFPLVARTDLIAEVGEDLPDTWEDVRRIAGKLKKKGHPLGIQLAHSNDSNNVTRGILWSHGGKLVEADSKTVAVNSKESIEAFKFVRALYKEGMEKEVLAWDDRNNNVCLVSGKCSMTFNPVSAYRSAVRDKALIPGTDRPLHQVINHVLPPRGPGGRHMAASFQAIGVWKFSENAQLAKEFLDFHFTKENIDKHLTASQGYNQPVLASFAMHPIYASSPKYYFAPYIGWYTHAAGYPGVPTAATQTVEDQFLLPDAMAACATDRATPEEAVAKLEAQLTRIYKRHA